MLGDPVHFAFSVSYARSDNATGWITRVVEELLAEHKRFTSGDGKPDPKREARRRRGALTPRPTPCG